METKRFPFSYLQLFILVCIINYVLTNESERKTMLDNILFVYLEIVFG